MTVKEADDFLPENTDMTHAFDVPARNYFTIAKSMERLRRARWERVGKATSDYFTAGVAYLANRGHDEYIQEVGTVSWWTINQRRAQIALIDNMIGAAVQLGVPPVIALSQYSINNEPHIIFLAEGKGIVKGEIAMILMPPEFIIKAQNKPIEALSTMSWICSQIRDYANGRAYVDQPNINSRAIATEAHFLLEAIKKHPETDLAPEYKRAIALYPEGIRTLPNSMKYKGISGTEFRGTPNN